MWILKVRYFVYLRYFERYIDQRKLFAMRLVNCETQIQLQLLNAYSALNSLLFYAYNLFNSQHLYKRLNHLIHWLE